MAFDFDDFEIAGTTYSFQTHRVGYGSGRCVAVNVKKYIWAKKRAELRKLVETAGEQYAYDLEMAAIDRVRESWWDATREYVKDLGLGEIRSEGRSGGWLIFEEWSETKIDDLREDVERHCANCNEHWGVHAKGKCLYDATHFENHDCTTKDLDLLVEATAHIKKSLEGDGLQDALDDEYEYALQQWAEDHNNVSFNG